ncbi:hypothetical protein C0Q70_19491 [Pomacea canaliculata]|uniref:EGF-like domain-containing protein n=1 Tax=Pomacea canaliculata TaxID=400727 RepID=A0A2T7NJI4_POMCA|nr:hypothetical protein C0Q70_19491 [Pomacea canaliculata]
MICGTGSSGCNETWVRETHGCVRVLEDGADWQTASNRCKQVSASLWQPPAMEDVAAVLTRYLADYPDNKNVTVRLGGTAKYDTSELSPLRYVYINSSEGTLRPRLSADGYNYTNDDATKWICRLHRDTACFAPEKRGAGGAERVSVRLAPPGQHHSPGEDLWATERHCGPDPHKLRRDAIDCVIEIHVTSGHRVKMGFDEVHFIDREEHSLQVNLGQGWVTGIGDPASANVVRRQFVSSDNVLQVRFNRSAVLETEGFTGWYEEKFPASGRVRVTLTSFCSSSSHGRTARAIDVGTRDAAGCYQLMQQRRALRSCDRVWSGGPPPGPASGHVYRLLDCASGSQNSLTSDPGGFSLVAFVGSRIPLSTIGDPLHLTSAPVWLRGEDVVSVVSVNFPLPYPDNAQQEVIVRAPIGSRVHVSIRHVNLEVTDRLEIDDVSLGESEQAERLLSVYGQEPSENEIESRLNRVRFRLTAGSRTNMKKKRSVQNNGASPLGFNISLKALPDPGYLNKSKTFFNSTFDSCAEKPCLNNGTCTQLSDVRAHCLCPPSYTGGYLLNLLHHGLILLVVVGRVQCETCHIPPHPPGLFCQVTWCELSVCEHGDCQTIGADPGFKCQCTLGFWGTRCHMDDGTCRREECNNRGTCIGNASQPVCECDAHETDPFCAPMVTNSITSSKSIGQRLLGEPIWIGLITIFVLLIPLRHHRHDPISLCQKVRLLPDTVQEQGTASNLLAVESHAPEVQAMATFSKTLPRLTRPAAVTTPSQTVMPTISITKAEEETAPQSLSPKVPETKVEAAARLFASYREAERTSISSPGLVDFSTTTDTFIALDSDDTSVGGIVEGQFLPDLSKRGGHESSTSSSSLRGLADKSPYREKIRRAHSTGPWPVREDTHSPNMCCQDRHPKLGPSTTGM